MNLDSVNHNTCLYCVLVVSSPTGIAMLASNLTQQPDILTAVGRSLEVNAERLKLSRYSDRRGSELRSKRRAPKA